MASGFLKWSISFCAFALWLLAFALVAACGGEPSSSPSPPVAPGEITGAQAVDLVLEAIASDPLNQPDRNTAKAALMDEGEAVRKIEAEAGSHSSSIGANPDRPVWLVQVRGRFVGFLGILGTRVEPPQSGTAWGVILTSGEFLDAGVVFDRVPTATP